jgi:hypothetical protein
MAIYPKLLALRRWLRLGYQVEKMSRSEGVEWRVSARQEEVSREAIELINRSSELSLGWIPLDVIGRRGRCFWTASCAESRDVRSCVGGVLVRSNDGRFQSSWV